MLKVPKESVYADWRASMRNLPMGAGATLVLKYLREKAVDGIYETFASEVAAALDISNDRAGYVIKQLIRDGDIISLSGTQRGKRTRYIVKLGDGSECPAIAEPDPIAASVWDVAPTHAVIRHADPVRRVVPGTFPTRGFSMLGGRL